VIAQRAPRPALLHPAGGRLYRAVFAAVFITLGGVVGYGVSAVTTPEPAPVVEPAATVAPDVAPACQEIGPAVQAERATATKLTEARELVLEASTELSAVALTVDEAAILTQAEVLDTAKRDAQQLGLDHATARAATDTAVTDCTKEAP
jgi:hypothetical protein